MKSFRSKPSGWQNDSARHSLAAKGIRTYNARKLNGSFIQNTMMNETPEEMDRNLPVGVPREIPEHIRQEELAKGNWYALTHDVPAEMHEKAQEEQEAKWFGVKPYTAPDIEMTKSHPNYEYMSLQEGTPTFKKFEFEKEFEESHPDNIKIERALKAKGRW